MLHLFFAYFPYITPFWALITALVFLGCFCAAWFVRTGSDARARLRGAAGCAMLNGYAFFMLAILVLSRGTSDTPSMILIPFYSYYKVLARTEVSFEWACLGLFNCLLFAPLGFFYAARLSHRRFLTPRELLRRAAVFGLLFSLSMETLQLLMRRGTFELDDILHNCLGTIIGACCWYAVSVIARASRRRSQP